MRLRHFVNGLLLGLSAMSMEGCANLVTSQNNLLAGEFVTPYSEVVVSERNTTTFEEESETYRLTDDASRTYYRVDEDGRRRIGLVPFSTLSATVRPEPAGYRRYLFVGFINAPDFQYGYGVLALDLDRKLAQVQVFNNEVLTRLLREELCQTLDEQTCHQRIDETLYERYDAKARWQAHPQGDFVYRLEVGSRAGLLRLVEFAETKPLLLQQAKTWHLETRP